MRTQSKLCFTQRLDSSGQSCAETFKLHRFSLRRVTEIALNSDARAQLGELPTGNRFETIFIDIVEGQSALKGSGSHRYILNIVDAFTE